VDGKGERTVAEPVGGRSSGEPFLLDLGEIFATLRRSWWKVALVAAAAFALAFLYMRTVPNRYRATAVVAPIVEDNPQSAGLGALASLGVLPGNPTKLEDLEALFKSGDLTVRVATKYGLLPFYYPERFGKKSAGWSLGSLFGGDNGAKPPGDWDAIRAVKDKLSVYTNKRTGNLSVSFESISPEQSAAIVGHYLEEAKSVMQEEALNRATQNKKFLGEQIERTFDPLSRERYYALYGKQVEQEMLARNREQFGFRLIDSPRVPDRKSAPARFKASLFFSLFAGAAAFLVLHLRRARS
jgi:uncharacterized protein involved in exopolysaccharide biosynthesis